MRATAALARAALAWVALAAAAGATHAQDPAAVLATARAAAERRDWGSALPLFARLAGREDAGADLLIEAARVHGFADRNAEAARLYRRALAAAPARRADIVPSLAWQSLWAGEAGAAAALFEEWRGSVRGRAALEPLDGLAQAERERGRTDAAAAALREALALAAGDAPQAARRTRQLAGVLNDAGRHGAALGVLGAPAAGDEERLLFARTWYWAGHEERALALLANAAAASEQAWLRDWRVARELQVHAQASFESSDDRDGLTTRATRITAGWVPQPGASIDFGVRRLELADSAGAPSFTQFEASARWRFGAPDAAFGTWWPQLMLRAHEGDGRHPLLPAIRLKWLPADAWRIDAEHQRELVENPQALANGVRLDTTALAAAWRADARFTFSGTLGLQRLDDGTERRRTLLRAESRLAARPRWTLGIEASGLERTQEGAAGSANRGYWNPRRYGEARLYAAFSHEWRLDARPLELQARAGFARSRETDDAGTRTSGSPHLWELAASVDFSPALRLRAAAGGSGRGVGLATGSSGAGYWRRWGQLAVVGWF